jgi:hypothetical protein
MKTKDLKPDHVYYHEVSGNIYIVIKSMYFKDEIDLEAEDFIVSNYLGFPDFRYLIELGKL